MAQDWLLPIIVTAVLAGVASVIGWGLQRAINDLSDRVRDLKESDDKMSDRISDLEKDYVPRAEIVAMVQNLTDSLRESIHAVRNDMVQAINRLSDKLDKKADKP